MSILYSFDYLHFHFQGKILTKPSDHFVQISNNELNLLELLFYHIIDWLFLGRSSTKSWLHFQHFIFHETFGKFLLRLRIVPLSNCNWKIEELQKCLLFCNSGKLYPLPLWMNMFYTNKLRTFSSTRV